MATTDSERRLPQSRRRRASRAIEPRPRGRCRKRRGHAVGTALPQRPLQDDPLAGWGEVDHDVINRRRGD